MLMMVTACNTNTNTVHGEKSEKYAWTTRGLVGSDGFIGECVLVGEWLNELHLHAKTNREQKKGNDNSKQWKQDRKQRLSDTTAYNEEKLTRWDVWRISFTWGMILTWIVGAMSACSEQQWTYTQGPNTAEQLHNANYDLSGNTRLILRQVQKVRWHWT